jgi:hypothetical protein
MRTPLGKTWRSISLGWDLDFRGVRVMMFSNLTARAARSPDDMLDV